MEQGPKKRADDCTAQSLVVEHIGWMLGLAQRILNDRMHAEDAVQNAFQKIFRTLDGFEGRASLKTWMHRIVVNEALMILRRQKTRLESSIDYLLPQFDEVGWRTDQALVVNQTPETLLNSAQTARKVQQQMMRLPENYRIVLILRDIEGLSTAEVGQMLDISESSVKTRLHRARAGLKKLLEPILSDENDQ